MRAPSDRRGRRQPLARPAQRTESPAGTITSNRQAPVPHKASRDRLLTPAHARATPAATPFDLCSCWPGLCSWWPSQGMESSTSDQQQALKETTANVLLSLLRNSSLTWPSRMPGSTCTVRVSASRSYFTASHCWHCRRLQRAPGSMHHPGDLVQLQQSTSAATQASQGSRHVQAGMIRLAKRRRTACTASTNHCDASDAEPGNTVDGTQGRLTSCVAYCWNMPGPSCRVTIRCRQLHSRLPGAGLMTFRSRVTCVRQAGLQ